jgi:thiol-disulfide isomerase/thioredoxin
MIKLKFFTMLSLFTFLLFSNVACTKENKTEVAKVKQENTNQVVQIAAADSKMPKVLDIKSVSNLVKGKAVNFTWEENGKTYSFDEVTKGKVVFLNFWATWCGPCKMEIPDIVALDKELPDKDFIVIGIALDDKGTLEQVRSLIQNFAKSRNMEYVNFLPTQDIRTPYGGISGIPTTFIIDKKGNISEKIVGARSKAEFLASIKKAMSAK